MPKTYLPKVTQTELDNLAKGCCEYCKQLQKFLTSKLHNEHIFPLSSGGKTILENLAKACETCNNCKQTAISTVDPLTDITVPLFHPREQIWNNHFKWSDDFCNPKTGTKCTIAAFQLK